MSFTTLEPLVRPLLILGVGALPALLALAMRSRMPESPRWLMHNKQLGGFPGLVL